MNRALHSSLYAALLASCAALFLPLFAIAQTTLSVSVTPPLFQLTIGPGETWSSVVKVVNSNPYDVTYYLNVADFEANGEDGSSKFLPILNATSNPAEYAFSLASWIEVGAAQVTVPGGSSVDVPFSVRVPLEAEPGGHYAAIMVGTQPPPSAQPGSQLKVSSYISSLLIVRIKGEAIESGRIREFSTARALYQNPTADFVLRFENMGTTHVRPRGDITIYNMWGKERGSLPINQSSNFGNVLPNSIRKFQFSWSGESSPFDIGRYSAVVTLSFGDEGKQNVSAVAYFWVVPLVPVSMTLGAILLFALLVAWFIRRYIRRALALERERLSIALPASAIPPPQPRLVNSLMEPLKEGVVDLRKMRAASPPERPMPPQSVPAFSSAENSLSFSQFMAKYKLFFLFIALVIVLGASSYWYFKKALVSKRGFQITDVQIYEEAVPEMR